MNQGLMKRRAHPETLPNPVSDPKLQIALHPMPFAFAAEDYIIPWLRFSGNLAGKEGLVNFDPLPNLPPNITCN
jgi:hypothetical protein